VAIYQNVDFSAQLILRSFQQIKGTIAHPNLPVKNNTLHELIRFFGAKYHLYRVSIPRHPLVFDVVVACSRMKMDLAD
jgi:hypothetical protein